MGKDGRPARAGHYTIGQTRKIIRFLENHFSREQVKTLIEDGVVEINRVMPVINTRKVLNELRKGREVFVSTVGGDYFRSRVSKVLEETKHGVLMELEHVNSNSGELTPHNTLFCCKRYGKA